MMFLDRRDQPLTRNQRQDIIAEVEHLRKRLLDTIADDDLRFTADALLNAICAYFRPTAEDMPSKTES